MNKQSREELKRLAEKAEIVSYQLVEFVDACNPAAIQSLLAEFDRLEEENAMLTEQRDEHARNSANATTQCIAYQQEIAELREKLAQELALTDWCLDHGVSIFGGARQLYLKVARPKPVVMPVNLSPRATIAELIAAEAAGGWK